LLRVARLKGCGSVAHAGHDRFEAVWPDVARKLMRMLRARGVSEQAIPDLVQEVGARLLSREVHFSCSDDLYPYAAQVARNLHVDAVRRFRACEADDKLSGLPGSDNVEHEVVQRAALEEALRCFRTMNERDQAAIRSAVSGRQATSRERVALHRARRRLAQAVAHLLSGAWAVHFARKAKTAGHAPALVAVGLALPILAVISTDVSVIPGSLPPPSSAVAPFDPTNGSGAGATTPRAATPASPDPESFKTASEVASHGDGATDPRRTHDIQVADVSVRYEERPRRPGDPLVCVFGLPVLERTCIDYPDGRLGPTRVHRLAAATNQTGHAPTPSLSSLATRAEPVMAP
jgi:DNA-directed RNA polymerase specialized sigma24 family protein